MQNFALRVTLWHKVSKTVYLKHLGPPRSENWQESENSFLQRFSSTKFWESNWILINISVYHTKLYGENPWILAKFHWENPNGFSHFVTNFWPWPWYFNLCLLSLVSDLGTLSVLVWLSPPRFPTFPQKASQVSWNISDQYCFEIPPI